MGGVNAGVLVRQMYVRCYVAGECISRFWYWRWCSVYCLTVGVEGVLFWVRCGFGCFLRWVLIVGLL